MSYCVDKNLMFQQNLERYSVTIVILNCIISKIAEIKTFMPSFKLQVDKLQKHKPYLINK